MTLEWIGDALLLLRRPAGRPSTCCAGVLNAANSTRPERPARSRSPRPRARRTSTRPPSAAAPPVNKKKF